MIIDIFAKTHTNIMSTSTFRVIRENSKLAVLNIEDEVLFISTWFMEFGKFASEIFDNNKNKLFTITKKFVFWKWRMVYKIIDSNQNNYILISQNARNTIYKIDYKTNIYGIKVHYNKRTSIFKNGAKIAELDASYKDKNYLDAIKLVTSEVKEIEIIFLLFSSLKIGESDQKKPALKSQKQLETNKNPWT